MASPQVKSTTDNARSDAATREKTGSAGFKAITLFAVPLGIVLLILCVSPNFDATNKFRKTPLGSDFLQDWVGAYIVNSPDRAELYEPAKSRTIQHDASVVGFEWPDESYYPMVYPPFFYAALAPLTTLPYQVAIWFWMLLLAGSLGTTFWLLAKFFPPVRCHIWKCVLAAIVFAPLLLSLNMAHKSLLILLILTSTYVLLFNRRPKTAGLVFGLIAFKPHIGIVIGLAMLAKRQWSFVFGTVTTVAALVGTSLLVGTDVSLAYLRQCLGLADYVHTGGYELNQAMGLWGAAQLSLPNSSETLIALVTATASLAVALVVLWSLRGPIDFGSPKFALQFAALVFATPLLCPHFYLYDLTILLLPLLLLAVVLSGEQQFTFQIDSRQKQVLLGIGAVLFVSSGLFAQIADIIGFQPAIIVIFAILIVIGLAVQRNERALEQTALVPSSINNLA